MLWPSQIHATDRGQRGTPNEAGGPALSWVCALAASDTPVVAVWFRGIGLRLLLHVDLEVAGENAAVETPFVSRGPVPEAVASAAPPRSADRLYASW